MANTQSKMVEEVEVEVSSDEESDYETYCWDCEGYIREGKEITYDGHKVCRECYEQICDEEGIYAEEDEEDE